MRSANSPAVALLLSMVLLFGACGGSDDSESVEADPAPVETDAPSLDDGEDYLPSYCGVTGPEFAGDFPLSPLQPDDWDAYCAAFAWAYTSVNPDCVDFLSRSDEASLLLLMSPAGGSNTRDDSIGIIDGILVKCG